MNLLYDILFIIGMLFSCIYAYILFKSKDKNLSKSILIVFFAIIVLVLLESYAFIHQIKSLNYLSFTFSYGSKLLIGPLLIIYIQALFLDDKSVLKRNKLFLIPYLLFTSLVSLPYAIARLFNGYFVSHIYLMENNSQYIRVGLDIVLLIFLIQGFKQFNKYKEILKCNYSNVEENNFIWVRYLLLSVAIIISIDFLIALSQLFLNAFPIRSQNIIMSLVALSIILGAYYGVNQSKVLVPYFLLEKEHEQKASINKILNITQEEEFSKLKTSLLQYISINKPYLDEELTLNKLAIAIGVTDKKLSALLNQYIKKSFYSFINQYRINEFKKHIASPNYKDYTIEGIAYECGFKSKASFYRMFKKETGQSPSEYKKSLV